MKTVCLTAARGAGLPWGLAEEAGYAAGWLTARGMDGGAALLAHLGTLAGGRVCRDHLRPGVVGAGGAARFARSRPAQRWTTMQDCRRVSHPGR